MLEKEAVIKDIIDEIIDNVQSFFGEKQELFDVVRKKDLRRRLENIVKNTSEA